MHSATLTNERVARAEKNGSSATTRTRSAALARRITSAVPRAVRSARLAGGGGGG